MQEDKRHKTERNFKIGLVLLVVGMLCLIMGTVFPRTDLIGLVAVVGSAAAVVSGIVLVNDELHA